MEESQEKVIEEMKQAMENATPEERLKITREIKGFLEKTKEAQDEYLADLRTLADKVKADGIEGDIEQME